MRMHARIRQRIPRGAGMNYEQLHTYLQQNSHHSPRPRGTPAPAQTRRLRPKITARNRANSAPLPATPASIPRDKGRRNGPATVRNIHQHAPARRTTRKPRDPRNNQLTTRLERKLGRYRHCTRTNKQHHGRYLRHPTTTPLLPNTRLHRS